MTRSASVNGQTLLPGMAPHSLIISLSESHLLSGWMAHNICTSNCPVTDGPNYGHDLSLCYLLFLQDCSYRPSFGLLTCLSTHSLSEFFPPSPLGLVFVLCWYFISACIFSSSLPQPGSAVLPKLLDVSKMSHVITVT